MIGYFDNNHIEKWKVTAVFECLCAKSPLLWNLRRKKLLFENYKDVVTINELMTMLRVGKNKAYELIRNGTIQTIKIGRKYIIPKISVIDFLLGKSSSLQ